jgi:hypothetical protein
MPHGLACSFTLPGVRRWNHGEGVGRTSILTEGLNHSSIEDLVQRLINLFKAFNVAVRVQSYIAHGPELSAIKGEFTALDRLENNIRKTTPDEAFDVVSRSLSTLQG